MQVSGKGFRMSSFFGCDVRCTIQKQHWVYPFNNMNNTPLGVMFV